MKDYTIRIENGHHIVDMSNNPRESRQLEIVIKEFRKGLENLSKEINKNFNEELRKKQERNYINRMHGIIEEDTQ